MNECKHENIRRYSDPECTEYHECTDCGKIVGVYSD